MRKRGDEVVKKREMEEVMVFFFFGGCRLCDGPLVCNGADEDSFG